MHSTQDSCALSRSCLCCHCFASWSACPLPGRICSSKPPKHRMCSAVTGLFQCFRGTAGHTGVAVRLILRDARQACSKRAAACPLFKQDCAYATETAPPKGVSERIVLSLVSWLPLQSLLSFREADSSSRVRAAEPSSTRIVSHGSCIVHGGSNNSQGRKREHRGTGSTNGGAGRHCPLSTSTPEENVR